MEKSAAFLCLQKNLCSIPRTRKKLFEWKNFYCCTDEDLEATLQILVKDLHVEVSADGTHFVLAEDPDLDDPPYFDTCEYLESRFNPSKRKERIEKRIEDMEQRIERLKKLKAEEVEKPQNSEK